MCIRDRTRTARFLLAGACDSNYVSCVQCVACVASDGNRQAPVYRASWLCRRTPCSRFGRVCASQTNWTRRRVLRRSSETLQQHTSFTDTDNNALKHNCQNVAPFASRKYYSNLIFSSSGNFCHRTCVGTGPANPARPRKNAYTVDNWFSRKLVKVVPDKSQMSDFNTKMHQIWFRLWLRPRPRWGSLQRSPQTL